MDITEISVNAFNKKALAYQEKFMDFDLYHDTFDFFCEKIPGDAASILDIACGPGNITRYLLNRRPKLNILGIDLAPNMIELAIANNPNASFQLMDGKDILSLDQKFDGLMAGFILPYLSKEETLKLIADASTLLNPKGILYLSTMEDDYEKSGFITPSFGKEDPFHVYYHQVDYLLNALKTKGFEILLETRKDYPEQDGTFTTDLILIAQKQSA